MKKLKILYEDKDLLVVRKDDKVLTVSDGKSYNTLYSEVYDYLHKKRDTSTDKFTMNNYISRRTLFRLVKKVKTNYETRLNI